MSYSICELLCKLFIRRTGQRTFCPCREWSVSPSWGCYSKQRKAAHVLFAGKPPSAVTHKCTSLQNGCSIPHQFRKASDISHFLRGWVEEGKKLVSSLFSSIQWRKWTWEILAFNLPSSNHPLTQKLEWMQGKPDLTQSASAGPLCSFKDIFV